MSGLASAVLLAVALAAHAPAAVTATGGKAAKTARAKVKPPREPAFTVVVDPGTPMPT